MFCILHISRSYPLDCYDYWSTSCANKQPRYILWQKKQNRYGGEKEGEGKEIKYFWMNLMRREAPWYLFLLSRRQLRSTAKTSRNWDAAQSRCRAFHWSPEVLKRCWSKVFFLPFFWQKSINTSTSHLISIIGCWNHQYVDVEKVPVLFGEESGSPLPLSILHQFWAEFSMTCWPWAEMPFHAAVQTPDQISEQCSRNLVKIVKIWSKELVNVVKYCKTWSKKKNSSKSRSVFCCRDMGGFKS